MKKYIEVYNHYKNLIEAGQYKKDDKMPSVRQSVSMLSVSKTTVENAYFELQADGYIISQPQSGYYVSYSAPKKPTEHSTDKAKNPIIFDLKSGDADSESFDLNLWQRYIKSALRQKERLLSYSSAEGEQDLREALSVYIRNKRNVVASPDRIIVGAGVQPLLSILCVLLKGRVTVSFPTVNFVQGISTFEGYGYDVHTRDKNADIIYVSPSHMTSYGDVMPITRRLQLVRHSNKASSMIIEDDFDSDFLYQTKPVPSLFALSDGGNVVYMGSFSNVLIPGIRISFMVLTDELAKKFYENKHRFAQTASKTEQIALCGYIRDGHIAAQTRKIRRHYTNKTKSLYDEIKRQIPHAEARLSENGLAIKMTADYNGSADEFEKKGIAVHIYSIEGGKIRLALIPSALEGENIPQAVQVIKAILDENSD
ncbi:MAG: PLP-dependent aminotransferase family protein [Eubacterium sp.]|nr:PLP-dependent aminotransferase family protein [Eubacterium sp.]